MTKVSDFQKAIIIIISLFGIIFSLPNFLPKDIVEKLPERLQPVKLGLDLQGGSQILLEVNFDAVLNDTLENLKDSVRQELRRLSINYDELMVKDKVLSFKLLNDIGGSNILSELRKIDSHNLEISKEGTEVKIFYNEPATISLKDKTINKSIETVRKRIDELGTREPVIIRQGELRILVQLPGVQNPEEVKELLGKTAKLSFHLVDESTTAEDAKRGKLPVDSKLIVGSSGSYVLKRLPVVGGEHLVDSRASFTGTEPVVSFEFDSFGSKKFGKATKENVGSRLAIVLDNDVISAPKINGPIMGGNGIIEGNFTVKSASELAMLLRSGALPAPLQVMEERTVGAGLGTDSIKSGSIACVIGLSLVVIFMLAFYGILGLFANAALLINVLLLLAVLSLLGATLTLPGIAGMVLTMGMAVDANILIFERIREESKKGLSSLISADNGFKEATATIVDSNLTTLIAGLVLLYFGNGPVKGFGVTLSIGILTTMFSAIMVTRLLMSMWLRSKRPVKIF